jgi:hypothetical protein
MQPFISGMEAKGLNPVPTGTGLTLNVSEDDNSLSLILAKEAAIYFNQINLKLFIFIVWKI